jgi:hypothetical protein
VTAEPRTLTREEVIERLATLIRNEAYPEFSAAPPPEWASRAAAKVIDFHQPMLRDTLLDATREQAATEARRELLAGVQERVMNVQARWMLSEGDEADARCGAYDDVLDIIESEEPR